jgi:hypothetical protein
VAPGALSHQRRRTCAGSDGWRIADYSRMPGHPKRGVWVSLAA